MLRRCKLWLKYEGNNSLPCMERCCHVRELFIRREWTEISCAPVGSRILVRVEGKVNECAMTCRECGDARVWAAWRMSRGKGRVCYLHVLIVMRPPPLTAECSSVPTQVYGDFCDQPVYTLAKLLKTTLSFMSVRPSTWKNSAPTGMIFMKFGNWVFFESLPRKFKFH